MGGWGRPNDYAIIQNLFALLIRFDYRLGGWGPKGSKSWLRNIWTVPNQGTLKEKVIEKRSNCFWILMKQKNWL